jgi:hypothetical protein
MERESTVRALEEATAETEEPRISQRGRWQLVAAGG